MRLLLCADDFTGALDTGVRFVKAGARAEVFLNCEVDFSAYPDTEVFIVDTETRHVPPKEAYHTVYGLVKRAAEAGITHFYKKTDSGLRGNIGPEIEALSDALSEKVSFVPAFPKMNRTVIGGFAYMDGVPANESVFAKDPFEPVTVFRVTDLFSGGEACVKVFDAETDRDLEELAEKITKRGAGNVVAGCAGFAEFYAKCCGFTSLHETEIKLNAPLLVVCGSINEISLKQVDHAAANGFSTVMLSAASADAVALLRETGVCILENREESEAALSVLSKEETEKARRDIAGRFGEKTEKIVKEGGVQTLIVIGGDTLYAAVLGMHAKSIRILRELPGGAVLSELELEGKLLTTISKSGGFGNEDWLTDILKEVVSE